MSYKTEFWSPLAVVLPLIPPIFTAAFLFQNWGSENDHLNHVDFIPFVLRPLYYLAAIIAVAVAALIVAPLLFVIGLPVALVHDAIVGIGSLTGCCEIEEPKHNMS